MIEPGYWYKFKNKFDKEEFLRIAVEDFNCHYDEVMMKAEALMIKKVGEDETYAIRYRTKIDERYMNVVKLYKGDEGMNCINECKDLAYPIRDYFDRKMREIDENKKVAMRAVIETTPIYKQAKAFTDSAKKMGNPYLDPCEMVLSLKLSDDINEKLHEVEASFEVVREQLSHNCRIAENLVHQADTYEQRLSIYKRYTDIGV